MTIVKQTRAFNALSRLLLSERERKLIKLQRRDRVLELNPNFASSNDSDTDKKFLKKFRKDELVDLGVKANFSTRLQHTNEEKLKIGIYSLNWHGERCINESFDNSKLT